MSDKKIIAIAIVFSAVIISAGWYYSKHQPPTAAILPTLSATPDYSAAKQAGITIGNPDAPVTTEEYTNFLCSHCQNFANGALKQIENDYVKTGKVKIIFYIYPAELGQAALCALEQNKFLEYHDYLFTHQLTQDSDITNFAVNAGLDGPSFSTCYSSDKYKDRVQQWIDAGTVRKIEGTPTFFINGQEIIGEVPYEDIQKVIEQKLNAAQ